MSHTMRENIILNVQAYPKAWEVLQEIFRAYKSEWYVNWDDNAAPRNSPTCVALNYLYERGYIVAQPIMPRAPYNLAPSEMALEHFGLWIGDMKVHEPRDADKGTLCGNWEE